MAFKDLEKRLEENGKLDQFIELLNKLGSFKDEEYRDAFAYMLSIVNDLNENDFSEYALIGGYAILAHLIDRFKKEKKRSLLRSFLPTTPKVYAQGC